MRPLWLLTQRLAAVSDICRRPFLFPLISASSPAPSEQQPSSSAVHYHFRPCYSQVAQVTPVFPIADLEKEVGVYSATPEFIRRHCGPIANYLLQQVPAWYYQEAEQAQLHVNCDIRIHRLYPSDYPAYPGWHCDGEYRETYFSQPDLNRIKVHRHLIATVSSHPEGVSNTEFLDEPFDFRSPSITPDHGLWQQVNEALQRRDGHQPLPVHTTKDGELMCFDSWSLHRVAPTKNRGWRMFFRMSMWHKPNLGAGGMVTKQEQVYKYVGGMGW